MRKYIVTGATTHYKKIFYVSIISIAFFNCIGVKPGGESGGRRLYETFYSGEQGVQYFIKPLHLKNKLGEKAVIDFSFRYKNEVKDSVIVNISCFNKELIKKLDSCSINNGKIKISLNSMKFLFLEREGNLYNLRYSTKASLEDIQKLFVTNTWTLITNRQNMSVSYLSEPGTNKKITKIHHYIFSLF